MLLPRGHHRLDQNGRRKDPLLEKYRGRRPRVWIEGQSHRYCSGYSAKEIKVAEVDSGILPSGWSIKMVRHIRLSLGGSKLCSDIRGVECENLTASAAEAFKIQRVGEHNKNRSNRA